MYTPLYIKTNYSLLSSLIKVEDLIEFAKAHNIPSLGICDNNMYITMKFYKLCKENNIKPIIGLEIQIDDYKILCFAKDYNGYKSLIKLETIQSKNKITLEELKKYNNSLITIIPYFYNNVYDKVKEYVNEIYIGISNKQEEKEAIHITNNIVYINETLYLEESDSKYLKYLTMIRDNKTISDDVKEEKDNFIRLNNIYNYASNLSLENTNIIADSCNLEFKKNDLLLPIYKDTKGLSSFEYLYNLTMKGLNKRFNGNVENKYIERLKYELNIIEKMGFSNYFLVVYDFIKYSKNNNILVGPGRGSAAGSLVSFSLGITDIDPIKYDLLFERFLNPERITMPDIDTDFPDIYRDQVIEYVKNKYGEKNVSGIITFGTLGAKQAIRDVSRTLNIALPKVDAICKTLPTFTKLKLKDFYKENEKFRNLIDSEKQTQFMFEVASYLEGFPRHTSMHAAGIVMSEEPLDEVIPLDYSDNMYVTGYSMEYLEELGLLKMDFLGLKNLTTIMNIIKDIKNSQGIDINFSNIPLNDKKALKIFYDANTSGIFQFESSGMRNFLRKLKPTTFEDIFAAIALFRPGPAVNIDSYIRRKEGKEPIDYIDPSLKPILENTYGIIIYQEQIMQIARTLAGYTLGEADILRRAMSKKKLNVLQNEEEKFIQGSIKNGYSKEIAKKVFDLILNFANYGFNRAHSVAYSIIAYKMAYLKAHFPKEFFSNLLSSVIGSESKTEEYIYEAKANNINILKPDINISTDYYKVVDEGIVFPLSNIKNIGTVACKQILDARDIPFTDLYDAMYKLVKNNISKKMIESLIYASCFDSFGYNKKTLIDNLDDILNYAELIVDLDPSLVEKPDIKEKEEYKKIDLIEKEKQVFGIYLSNHPTLAYKNIYKTIELTEIDKYLNKQIDLILLIEKIKIIDTKKKEKMAFITASDDKRTIELTLFPRTYNYYLDIIEKGKIIKVKGMVEKRYASLQVIVSTIEVLD